MTRKPIVAISFREGGENGGPFVSHRRVMESSLKLKYDFVPLEVPVAKRLQTVKGMSEFVNTIRAIDPDMIHFAGLQLEGFFVSLALREAGVSNSLLAIHGSSSEAIELAKWKKVVLALMERATVKNAKYCFAVSEYVRSWSVCDVGHNCLGVAYNMIGGSLVTKSRDVIRREMSIPDDAVIVVSTGRVITEKGYDQLLPICDLLYDDGGFANLYFVIVGAGDYSSQLAREISSKSYFGRIRLVGYKENVKDYLNASDIYWTSTKHETLGCSIIEACDFSLPVVATNVGGIPEVVVDGVGGYLIMAGNIEEFAAAIARLALSEEKRHAMGENARLYAKAKFSDTQIACQLDKFYQQTLQ